ncbi:MAG: Type secretion system protein [Candidatus Sumerlaeota bacterium]|nr:Type secretion system protein [Candidatus Sumerlaeota bacterium]
MIRKLLAVLLLACAVGTLFPVWRILSTTLDRRAIAESAREWKNRTAEAKEKTEKPPEKDERIAKWEKGGILGPPPPSIPPPTLSAIIGESAILNNRTVKVGDTVGDGMKVVEIEANKVVLEKDGNRTDLVLFPELKRKAAKK